MKPPVMKEASLIPVRMSLSDQTYEALKEQILDQQLAPGERLNIDALSRALNVSSSPIREALARLEAERLVVSTVNTGYSVAPSPTPQFLRDLYEYRMVVEGYCARVGVQQATAETRAALEKAVKKMASMNKLGPLFKQYRDYSNWDIYFHQTIVDSAENEVLSLSYRSMSAVLIATRLSLFRDDGCIGSDHAANEHSEILAGYLTRDSERAEAGIRNHLRGAQDRVLNALEKRQRLEIKSPHRWYTP